MDVSRVVVIRSQRVLSSNGDIDTSLARRMFRRGLALLSDQKDPTEFVHTLFTGGRIGIKVNTIGGKKISTRPEVAAALADTLSACRVSRPNIVIWDRTNREMKEAGYRLSMKGGDVQVYGTDSQGVGYSRDLRAHLSIGSLYSKIQESAQASISLAILKDHGLAGVTAGMKNYFGAIHNPNKYHDFHCNPYVAEVFDSPPVKDKHKISMLDALVVQYHRGPSYHPRWAEPCRSLIFSLDPVAADRVGCMVIEKLRTAKGLPTLKEENREPLYLAAAQKMGLGKAALKDIDILEEDI